MGPRRLSALLGVRHLMEKQAPDPDPSASQSLLEVGQKKQVAGEKMEMKIDLK